MKYIIKHSHLKTQTKVYKAGDIVSGQDLNANGIELDLYRSMGVIEVVQGTEDEPDPIPATEATGKK